MKLFLLVAAGVITLFVTLSVVAGNNLVVLNLTEAAPSLQKNDTLAAPRALVLRVVETGAALQKRQRRYGMAAESMDGWDWFFLLMIVVLSEIGKNMAYDLLKLTIARIRDALSCLNLGPQKKPSASGTPLPQAFVPLRPPPTAPIRAPEEEFARLGPKWQPMVLTLPVRDFLCGVKQVFFSDSKRSSQRAHLRDDCGSRNLRDSHDICNPCLDDLARRLHEQSITLCNDHLEAYLQTWTEALKQVYEQRQP